MVCKRDYGEPLADVPALSEPDDIGQCSVGLVAPTVSVVQVQGRLREHADICAGFILNDTKSKLEPQQVGLWLSFTLDLLEGGFLVRTKS